jgi:hypothetical protein
MTLLLLVGVVIFFLNLRCGVVGIHGGGVERAENPPLYWAAMTLMATCLVGLSCILIFDR